MKRVLSLLIAIVTGYAAFAQSQPDNLRIGVFNNGANGTTVGSGAHLEISLRTATGTYAPTPVAEDFIFILKAPKTQFSKTETVNLVQQNATLFTASGSMTVQPTIDLADFGGDDGFVYFPIVLQSTGIGINLSSVNSTSWTYAFTFSFSTSKTQAQINTVRILDRLNNAQINAVFADVIHTRINIAGANQLVTAGFTALPVTFSKYEVTCNDKGAILTWTTSSERNSSHYDIEKNTNGVWTKIDQVAAAGNSNSDKSYRYLDLDGGAAQYRVKQVDLDGRSVYTAVRNVNCETKNVGVVLFPIPAKDNLNLTVKTDRTIRTTIQVLDVSGRMVKSQAVVLNNGSNNISLNVGNLSTGEYMLVSSEASLLLNKKFTIVR